MEKSSSSLPGHLPFYTYQGDVFRRHITVTADGDPVDLTGYSARMQVWSTRAADTASLTLTDGDGITLGDALGTIDLFIAATDMADLTGAYTYDLELSPSADEAFTLLEGAFDVTDQVSR